jgi:fructose-1,6-bisphosphatase/inositol monophosphatase family enzyme
LIVALTQLELDCLAAFRSRTDPPARGHYGADDEAWSVFTLRLLLEAARVLRPARLHLNKDSALKTDGSPTVQIEQDVEARLRELVAGFDPDAAFVGEEQGGTLPPRGIAVAVDPIDGTWAFLNDTETFATSIAVFRDGEVLIGAVCNPATGEIAYTDPEAHTRLVQLSAFGESDVAANLPASRAQVRLVNVHPSKTAGPLMQTLHEAWRNGEIRMVRSPGGSPAWALLEAAKGSFVYVNLWSKRSAEPYDLAGSTLLVRCAGGDVVDLDGRPINALSHAGPLIASADVESARAVSTLVRSAMPDGPLDPQI